MANTRIQHRAEASVRDTWMTETFGISFSCAPVKLSAGGFFEFDAVNMEHGIVACISTSCGKTATGKLPTGKLMKIRSDTLFLSMAVAMKRRLLVFTEEDMLALCAKERKSGRLPAEIELHLAQLPDEVRVELVKARAIASKEVSPATAQQLPDEMLLNPSGK